MLELADLIKNMMDRRDIDLVEGSITQGSPYRRCPDTKRIDNAMQNSSRISLETGVRATLNTTSSHDNIKKIPLSIPDLNGNDISNA